MRVGIIALLHESNTFVARSTALRQFAEDTLVVGEAVRQRFADTHHEVGGFCAGLAEAQVEAVPIFAARAVPSGTIEAATYFDLLTSLFTALDDAGRLDGLLVAPHGAMVSELYPDADGDWLTRLRDHVGPDLTIMGTLDLHANLSPAMVAATNAMIAYRSNPHLDQWARGREAAILMARTLAGQVRPVQAAAFPPIAINIERQLTGEPPCRDLYEQADALLRRDPRVLSNSIVLGFPYADVAEMGSATIVVADGDPLLAQRLAHELAAEVWDRRQSLVGEFVGIEECLRRCPQLPGPICLLDMGDNVGGGSPGDGTLLAHALRAAAVGPAFVCLYDPAAARQAIAAGVGARLRLEVGGKTDTRHGQPLVGDFSVTATSDGQFVETQPRHGGLSRCDQGPTAVVVADALTVMLTSKRMPPFSLEQLLHCGVDPSQFRVLVAKGVHAPVAAYAPVCPILLRVDTPGCTRADMTQLPYRRRRQPLFPFELDTDWTPGE